MGLVSKELLLKSLCSPCYSVSIKESHHLDLDYIGNADACHHTEGKGLDELFQRTKSSIFKTMNGRHLKG